MSIRQYRAAVSHSFTAQKYPHMTRQSRRSPKRGTVSDGVQTVQDHRHGQRCLALLDLPVLKTQASIVDLVK